MVGIVLISHSPALAEGAAELARAMGVGKAVVEPAGGDVDGGLGTSIELVEHAVARADAGDGVLLLADLGSSVLTARTFIEDAEDAGDVAVLLADAPLVEGAVAAASMAATGAGLAAVRDAAEAARDHRKLR
ncbi:MULTISPECIES: dihydroxyacetone kinase phosphoryl donor subunit DhaM [Actinomadura]|uniref:phosphoenolpyruvate--glycerone phosphotransferase n=1 Tax=Actinomadura litoris TaxID=2678616 RepID=A0A7K1L7V3_9ACTN|nr:MULTISPECIES: dihydroxyacetone kinase phosphoryl donor subunit DhaM [Actinomadura]MBT2210508.1 phosphoenolpyruvate--protein phosphotransferase [Actinomadura sp. NEAU-AAG7]MUN40498.1 phosphoenolpyruvate--protein phosphotransferase [Actinomadura litoris]